MRTIRQSSGTIAFTAICITIGWLFWGAGTAFAADQALPSNLSPGLQEVVKLSKAQMGDAVILAYIKNSGTSYTLSADDILYLKSQSVSQNVIAALLQTKSAASSSMMSTAPDTRGGTARTSVLAPASSGVPPEPRDGGSTPLPSPASQPVANTGNAQASAFAPQENTGLVQEYNGYTFELKECKVEDRQDRPVNDGRPHQQLVCKVLVTNKAADRKLNMCGEKNGEHTRVIDDRGAEYDFSTGSLGTSQSYFIINGFRDAALVLPSGVPIEATLYFGIDKGVGYFSPQAKSLGVLDIIFTSNDTGGGSFHVQFKNVPVPLEASSAETVASTPAPAPSTVPPEAESESPTTAQAPAPAAEPVVNADYVQQQLSPYGAWVDVPEYGQCWQPSSIPLGWRPYYDSGHWVYTDAGLYWQSDYPWGAIPFHYGRWAYVGGYGWIWVPGYEYAPAWVVWRHTDGYVGWAPLPYGAVWVSGGWWQYRGVRVAADYDFGLGVSFFAFVDYHHLWEHDYHPYVLHHDELHRVYRQSVINRFGRDEHGRFVNEGLDRQHLERFTGRKVDVVRHEELQKHERVVLQSNHARAVESSRSQQPAIHQGEPHQGEPKQVEPRQGEPRLGEPRQGGPENREHPDKGKQPEKGGHPDKDEKKNPEQSKGNVNQRFAQLRGSFGF